MIQVCIPKKKLNKMINKVMVIINNKAEVSIF